MGREGYGKEPLRRAESKEKLKGAPYAISNSGETTSNNAQSEMGNPRIWLGKVGLWISFRKACHREFWGRIFLSSHLVCLSAIAYNCTRELQR